MKKSLLAFILSLFIPGLGLAYLGYWAWAAVNFILFVSVVFILPFALAAFYIDIPPYLRTLALPLALLSGLLGLITADKMSSEDQEHSE